MEPFDDDRDERRKKNPFDFIDDEEFERIFEEMRRIFESGDFKDVVENMFRGGFDPNKRFIHGFSVQLGPDGKPKIQEFGNRPKKTATGPTTISDEREPLTDIIEGDETVAITVEIPGVEKEDINLNVTDNTLEIRVDVPQRKYYKTVDLPCGVKPKSTKATYKNGILDIVIEKKEKTKGGSGHRVTIG